MILSTVREKNSCGQNAFTLIEDKTGRRKWHINWNSFTRFYDDIMYGIKYKLGYIHTERFLSTTLQNTHLHQKCNSTQFLGVAVGLLNGSKLHTALLHPKGIVVRRVDCVTEDLPFLEEVCKVPQAMFPLPRRCSVQDISVPEEHGDWCDTQLQNKRVLFKAQNAISCPRAPKFASTDTHTRKTAHCWYHSNVSDRDVLLHRDVFMVSPAFGIRTCMEEAPPSPGSKVSSSSSEPIVTINLPTQTSLKAQKCATHDGPSCSVGTIKNFSFRDYRT